MLDACLHYLTFILKQEFLSCIETVLKPLILDVKLDVIGLIFTHPAPPPFHNQYIPLLYTLFIAIIALPVQLGGSNPIDISSMLFQSTMERILYVALLASSFFSVCLSFAK